ncbi:hypothetical protein [Planomicrobium okeanokoites]|uniref:hypothetical protein n=1 Tax=Planomicrobium okeanokoites TaxID=244 RepID=UPI0024935C32|nr:hypothetical protein [Planomicrobium okeanokoites]
MFSLSFIPTLTQDVSFLSLMQENLWLFIPAIVVLWLSLLMRVRKVLAAQVLLLIGIFIAWNIASEALFIGMMVLQTALSIWMLIRVVIEIEWSYSRRLEKTHFIPRNITKGGNAGIRDYRF